MSFVNVTGVFVVSAAYVNNGTARTTSAHTLRSLNFAICRAPPNWCSDLIVWFLILFAATWVKQELPTATMSYILRRTASHVSIYFLKTGLAYLPGTTPSGSVR